MNIYTPIIEDGHWCCPTCKNYVKDPKKCVDERNIPLPMIKKYEIWIKQDDKEYTGYYSSLLKCKNGLEEKGFNISLNQLFSCLNGKHNYKWFTLKQLISNKKTNRVYKGGRPALTADKYEIWVKNGEEEYTGRYPSMNKASEELIRLGFSVNLRQIMYSLHKKFDYNHLRVNLI